MNKPHILGPMLLVGALHILIFFASFQAFLTIIMVTIPTGLVGFILGRELTMDIYDSWLSDKDKDDFRNYRAQASS